MAQLGTHADSQRSPGDDYRRRGETHQAENDDRDGDFVWFAADHVEATVPEPMS